MALARSAAQEICSLWYCNAQLTHGFRGIFLAPSGLRPRVRRKCPPSAGLPKVIPSQALQERGHCPCVVKNDKAASLPTAGPGLDDACL